MRSLSDPDGLKYSSLTRISALIPRVTRLSRTKGVEPIVARIDPVYLRFEFHLGMRADHLVNQPPRIPGQTPNSDGNQSSAFQRRWRKYSLQLSGRAVSPTARRRISWFSESTVYR